MGMSEIEMAEKKLKSKLNYGGIVRDPGDQKLVMEYRQGDLPDEIGQMRRLASAFNELADILEHKGLACSTQLPSADDADEGGYVEWLQNGKWSKGLWDEKPIDATRWRCTDIRA